MSKVEEQIKELIINMARKKLKPMILYAVKPKVEDWFYYPEDVFPTKKDALKRKKEYTHPEEMEIIKIKLMEIK